MLKFDAVYVRCLFNQERQTVWSMRMTPKERPRQPIGPPLWNFMFDQPESGASRWSLMTGKADQSNHTSSAVVNSSAEPTTNPERGDHLTPTDVEAATSDPPTPTAKSSTDSSAHSTGSKRRDFFPRSSPAAWQPNEVNGRIDEDGKRHVPASGERFVKNVAAFLTSHTSTSLGHNEKDRDFKVLEDAARPFMHPDMLDQFGRAILNKREERFRVSHKLSENKYRYLRARLILGFGLIIEQNARAFSGRLQRTHPMVVSRAASEDDQNALVFWRYINIGKSQAQMLCPGVNVIFSSIMYQFLERWILPVNPVIEPTSDARVAGRLRVEIDTLYQRHVRESHMDALVRWEDVNITRLELRTAIRRTHLETVPQDGVTVTEFFWAVRRSS